MEVRRVAWMGNSLEQLRDLPDIPRRFIGAALFDVQTGITPPLAKPLRGIGKGIFEIVARYDKETYRAVYAVKIGELIYVLHVFQKKSKSGISIPPRDLNLIKQRYQRALLHGE